MEKPLFANFLLNPEEYQCAEGLWSRAWRNLLESADGSDHWESPWLGTTFANGTPCRDGNPIFSAVCPSRRLGIRVIQLDPSEGPDALEFRTGRFAEGDPEEVRELVIACVLTNGNLRRAVNLMNQWIHGEKLEPARTGLQ